MQAEQHILCAGSASAIERLSAISGVAALTTASAAVWYFDPAKANFFPACLLFSVTGFACPGCGLTRGFHELFHGRFIPALDFNLLIPAWTFVLGYVWISLLLLSVRGRGLPMWIKNPTFLWASMVVLLTFGVLRNIPVWPLTILFP